MNMKNNTSKLASILLITAGVFSAVPAAFAAPEFPVPEAGSTILFLGLAVFGIEVARRKLRK
jgi:hypothetical protein